MNVPFLDMSPAHSTISQELSEAFQRVRDSNWFVLGSELACFEREYADFNGVAHCIGVSNGLDALILCLKALNVGPGDEVIVPSNTYIATALAVTHVGARPIFVEPRLETYNINPESIERSITSRTKAIIPVHLYGQACEMGVIMALAEAYSLSVVEDNAQAHAASWSGKMTGSFGHCNATSYYPGKNLGALGDGGAVTTDDTALAERVRMLRNYGSREKYYNEELGFNNRLDEMQAAFLRAKLRHLGEWTGMRRNIAEWYQSELKGLPGVIIPYIHPDATHSFHLYVIRTDRRDQLQSWLRERGIHTLIHYPVPPHMQRAYKGLGLKRGDFPIAEEISDTALSLPLWPGMTREQVFHVAAAVRGFFS